MPRVYRKRAVKKGGKPSKQKSWLPYRRKRSNKQLIFQISAVLVVLFAWKYYRSLSPLFCEDPLSPLCPDRFFSESYHESRSKFIKLSSSIENAKMLEFPVYESDSTGILTMDITIINEKSTSNHMIIHLSGTHGVEGYAGSAIQIAILEHIRNITQSESRSSIITNPLFDNYTLNHNFQCKEDDQQDKAKSNDDPILVFVHSVNPYGFHLNRRYNENGVDLNRNCKNRKEWDYSLKMDRNNTKYKQLFDYFNPKHNLTHIVSATQSIPKNYRKYAVKLWSFYNFVKFGLRSIYQMVTVGQLEVGTTYISGQHFYNQAVSYNGRPYKLEKSHEILEDFLLKRMYEKEHPEWKKQINKISFIDVHTGLGTYSYDQLIMADGYEKMQKFMPKHDMMGLVTDLKGLAGGIYNDVNGLTFGHVDRINELLLTDNGELDNVVVSQEFGTVPQWRVFWNLLYENSLTRSYNEYLEHNSDAGALSDEMAELLTEQRGNNRDAFFCEYVDWKTAVVKRGFSLFSKMFNR